MESPPHWPASPPATAARGHVARVLVLLAYAAAIAVREPQLVLEPRLWGEEGSVYLQHALGRSWHEALVAPHLDYVSFVANLGGVLAAHAGSLELAPVATLVLSWIVQLVPAALVLWGGALLWQSLSSRILGLLVLLLVPLSGEIWLTTIGSQFHLAVATVLVLMEPTAPHRRFRAAAHRGVLAVAGLTGPVSCLVAPAFVVRAVRRRDREAWVHAVLLSCCAVVQGVVFLASRASGARPIREAGTDLLGVGPIAALRTVVLPVAGVRNANEVAVWIERAAPEGSLAWTILGLGCVVLLAVALVALARRFSDGSELALAYAVLVVTSTLFAAGTGIGASKYDLLAPEMAQRYFYAPSVTLALLVLAALRRGSPPPPAPARAAMGFVLVATLALGAIDFRRTLRPFLRAGPRWTDEVAAWRADAARPLRVWPASFQVVVDAPR